MIALGYSLGKAVGRSLRDCYVLGFRFEAEWGFKPEQGESWLVRVRDGRLARVLGGPGWFTGLWQAPSGNVYVADSASGVRVGAALADPSPAWTLHELPFFVRGVWGLDDTCVFAWGSTAERAFLAQWNGRAWLEWPVPGGEIYGMHGLASGQLYAVGDTGLVARWDGSRWLRLQTNSTAALSSVFVASPDEIYACGNGRRLLEGSAYGWAERATADSELLDVARIGDAVWVAAPAHGLMRLERDRLELLNRELKATRIVPAADGGAFIPTRRALAHTFDGAEFEAIGVTEFEATFGGLPPQWRD